MENKHVTTKSAEETQRFGRELASTLVPGTLLCLTGDLGAGKTTLVQGLLAGLGAERPFVSPTFVLMKQYELSQASVTGIERIYHADAYRVGAKDFIELGFAEWCADPHGLVILEWPERIAEILPEKSINLSITALSENDREIRVSENEKNKTL